MKRLVCRSTFGFCLLLLPALAACSGSGPATSSAPPQVVASPSPTAVSSSADVVKIGVGGVSLSAGGGANAMVVLLITPGYHVNANPATFSYLIATELTPGKADGINAGAPSYPAGEKKKFQFAEEPLAVYEGQVPINFKLSADKKAASGFRSLPITVKVQACNEVECFRPATLDAKLSVTVK